MTQDLQHRRTWINLKDVVLLSIMCVVSFLIETTLGLVAYPFMPLPLMGGLISSFVDATMIFVALYMVPRQGAALYFGVLLLTLSSVTPSFGPIGIYKVTIGVALGLAIDIPLILVGRGRWVYVISIAAAFGLSIPVTYFAWISFSIPGADKLRPALYTLTLVYAVLGGLGASFGAWVFENKLMRHAVVQRMRGAN